MKGRPVLVRDGVVGNGDGAASREAAADLANH
jgi:hypothetical protein